MFRIGIFDMSLVSSLRGAVIFGVLTLSLFGFAGFFTFEAGRDLSGVFAFDACKDPFGAIGRPPLVGRFAPLLWSEAVGVGGEFVWKLGAKYCQDSCQLWGQKIDRQDLPSAVQKGQSDSHCFRPDSMSDRRIRPKQGQFIPSAGVHCCRDHLHIVYPTLRQPPLGTDRGSGPFRTDLLPAD